jgi:hypothetical protein
MNNEISDNLDLRAVADILEIQEILGIWRQLNDPELQISNLDLNNDNEDYLRVIETVDNRTHVIIQSVLDRDISRRCNDWNRKDRYNTVHLQIVGNEYMYGQNYIYEPILQYTCYFAFLLVQ